MRAASVSIVHPDSRTAGRQAASELLLALGEAPDLVLVFISSQLDVPAALSGLWSRLPETTKVAGCSSFAEFDQSEAITGSVTAMGMCGVDAAVFKTDRLGDASHEAGRHLGEQAKAFGASLLFAFPDGITGRHTRFLQGLQSSLGTTFPIVGGVAAEHLAFVQTYEICQKEALSGGAVVVALRGRVQVATAARAGFQAVGLPRTCTRTQGESLIVELNGSPASQMYRDFLGDNPPAGAMMGIEFPLMVGVEDGNKQAGDSVIRVVRQIDEASSGLLLGGDIAEGSTVRMTRASREGLLQGTRDAVTEAQQKLPDPDAVFLFGCAGRKLILGASYPEEMKIVREQLGESVPKVGFYTYGELSPVNGRTLYHDETFTLALVKVD